MTPTIVLVMPQMGENIGMAARAMGNFDFTDLRLVAPRDGWPNPNAVGAAADSPVLKNVQVFETLHAALHDQRYVYGTSVRQRHMQKAVMTPGSFVADAQVHQDVAVVFGGERAGLSNGDLSYCNAIIEIPTSDQLPSINLAQTVFAICYTWRGHMDAKVERPDSIDPPAAKNELQGLFDHLESALGVSGFFYPAHKKKVMAENIRHSLQRANFTTQEVRTWRGIVEALAKKPHIKRGCQSP